LRRGSQDGAAGDAKIDEGLPAQPAPGDHERRPNSATLSYAILLGVSQPAPNRKKQLYERYLAVPVRGGFARCDVELLAGQSAYADAWS
jgi:hypothetical protein